MIPSLLGIFRPAAWRSFSLDLGLALAAFFLWLLLDCFQVHIAFSREVLRVAVDHQEWQLHPPSSPWFLGAIGLFLAYARQRFFSLSEVQGAILHRRLRQVTRLTWGLAALRLLVLWDIAGCLFPYLSILWAPHSLWALALLYLLFLHAPIRRDSERPGKALTTRRTAALLFLGSALLYGAYTLYFCQVTTLHGDEGQYLRVTQSLLRDGDMDLANNLDFKQIQEFHVASFAVHKAPGSPPGKVHSVHPVGLSVLLLPAYWAGLELWENPRLATALFMALLAAACLPLAFVWLMCLGIGRAVSLLSVGIMALTVPFFLYSNQLFPEVPALLITFFILTLLAHWQVPGGGYRPLGRWEPGILGFLILLLTGLLFLHPRFLPLAVLIGGLVLLQGWHSPQKRASLAAIGLVAALGLYALLAFNYAFSNDWMGPFRPGNAWEEGTLDISTWPTSLPGYWLHGEEGIINSSPVFMLCLVGWTSLLLQRDRRLLLVVGLYGTTAAVSGLQPNWASGFSFQSRFLMTAMPVLLYGLARTLRMIWDRAIAFFLLAEALTISLDSVLTTLSPPELGYQGKLLLMRSINRYYPWDVHFVPDGYPAFPWYDLSFWLILLVTMTLILIWLPPGRRYVRAGAVLLASLLPFVWGQSDLIAARLGFFPYIPLLRTDEASVGIIKSRRYKLTQEYYRTTGEQQEDGRWVAREGKHRFGILTSYHWSFVPGMYRLSLYGLWATPNSGYVTVDLRQTVPALSTWGKYLSCPLESRNNETAQDLVFYSDCNTPGHVYVEFSGLGELSLRQILLEFWPEELNFRSAPLRQFAVPEASDDAPIDFAALYQELASGYYKVQFGLKGITVSSFFERNPEPVYMAIYARPPTEAERFRFREWTAEWFSKDGRVSSMNTDNGYILPLVESIQPPWWVSAPFGGIYELDFVLDEPKDVWFLIKYHGIEDFHLEDVTLYQLTPDLSDRIFSFPQRGRRNREKTSSN